MFLLSAIYIVVVDMPHQASELETLESILINTSAEPAKLTYALIKSIARNFSQEIGHGRFGVVYLGVLQNRNVAVKKLSSLQGFSDELFADEIKSLMMAKHNNIVRFLGYCSDTQEELSEINGRYIMAEVPQKFLCFEYVANGSLQRYLTEKSHVDQWQIRYNIIKGICQGINYLHKENIIHLDLKPENVLLDAHMEPKLMDFGLSRCFDEGQSRIITKFING
uniref:non-specific serine/threonine protein kinase n=1 Tax=Triticum urartu TaxID=4572 RepID=A0A8R7UAJ1_TRIUA